MKLNYDTLLPVSRVFVREDVCPKKEVMFQR